jgi:hypothetical protein
VHPNTVEILDKLGATGGSFAAVYSVNVDGWRCAMKEVDTLDLGAEAGVENEIVILMDLVPHTNVCKYVATTLLELASICLMCHISCVCI